jgi:hypothetical protein
MVLNVQIDWEVLKEDNPPDHSRIMIILAHCAYTVRTINLVHQYSHYLSSLLSQLATSSFAEILAYFNQEL